MPGGEWPSRRTRRQCRERKGGNGPTRHGGAPRGGPSGCAGRGPCLASVASRLTRATFLRLYASRRSANPSIGVGRDEGKKEGRRTRMRNEPGAKGLFDM